MRCNDCSKFVSMETECEDPELEAELDGLTVKVTGHVRMVRNCAECGTELKSTEFEIDAELEIPADFGEIAEDAEAEVSDESAEPTESGGGRYAKNMIGFDLSCEVKVGGKKVGTLNHHDELQASAWDEN